VTDAIAGLACHSRPHTPISEVQLANADGCQLATQLLPRVSEGNQMVRQVPPMAMSLTLVTVSRQPMKTARHQPLADSAKAPCSCATVGYEAIAAPKVAVILSVEVRERENIARSCYFRPLGSSDHARGARSRQCDRPGALVVGSNGWLGAKSAEWSHLLCLEEH
jgi:hypothetical protein